MKDTRFTVCSCRRPHIFVVAAPGIYRRRCDCGNFVTVVVPKPSRWVLLEVD